MSEDAVRELEKAANVLRAVERYLSAYNESMAALHMSDKVMASPLTSAVQQAAFDCEQAVERMRA